MGLWARVAAWTGGVDLDEEAQRAEQIRQQDLQLQAKRLQQGKIDDAAYQDQLTRIQADYEQTANIEQDVQDAFDQEYDAGLNRLTKTASGPFNVFGDVVGSLLKALPWWLWVALLAYLAFQFGLFKKLVKR